MARLKPTEPGVASVPNVSVPAVLRDPASWRDRWAYNDLLRRWAIRQGLTGDRVGTVDVVALKALGLRRYSVRERLAERGAVPPRWHG